jgi:hypothetical protein
MQYIFPSCNLQLLLTCVRKQNVLCVESYTLQSGGAEVSHTFTIFVITWQEMERVEPTYKCVLTEAPPPSPPFFSLKNNQQENFHPHNVTSNYFPVLGLP